MSSVQDVVDPTEEREATLRQESIEAQQAEAALDWDEEPDYEHVVFDDEPDDAEADRAADRWERGYWGD